MRAFQVILTPEAQADMRCLDPAFHMAIDEQFIYEADGNVVSLEILDASRRVVQPTQMVCELAGYTI